MQTQGLPDALFLCRENGGQQIIIFLASSCLTPNKELLYLIRNGIRLLIEQIQTAVFSNQICS